MLVLGVVWRAGRRYLMRVLPPMDSVLTNYLHHEAIATISGSNTAFRTTIIQWHDKAVVLTLPSAMNPTWEQLWQSNKEVTVELVIKETTRKRKAASEDATINQ